MSGQSVAVSPEGPPRKAAPGLSPKTQEFCRRHGLDEGQVETFPAKLNDAPVDILYLDADQFARIPAADRPSQTLIARSGLTHLVFLPLDA